MPIVYPYTFSSEGTGPWWGIRCSSKFYDDSIRQLQSTRCFVYITNIEGESLAIAVEGPYADNITDDVVFIPSWVFERLTLSEGDEIIMEPILEPLPKGETITIRPMTGVTVESPIFLEGLTEALNQLGVIQEGVLSAIVDPSMPDLHQFLVESLTPNTVCLADGELRVEIERAVDRPPSPVASPEPVVAPEQWDDGGVPWAPIATPEQIAADKEAQQAYIDSFTVPMPSAGPPQNGFAQQNRAIPQNRFSQQNGYASQNGFVPFSGKFHCLGKN
jgi:hypothetical protein